MASRRVPHGVGDGTLIEGAIIDKNCRIGQGVRVCNPQNLQEAAEEAGVMIRDGIICVMKEESLPNGWHRF